MKPLRLDRLDRTSRLPRRPRKQSNNELTRSIGVQKDRPCRLDHTPVDAISDGLCSAPDVSLNDIKDQLYNFPNIQYFLD